MKPSPDNKLMNLKLFGVLTNQEELITHEPRDPVDRTCPGNGSNPTNNREPLSDPKFLLTSPNNSPTFVA